MKKIIVAGLVLAASVALAPLALAADTPPVTGPDSPACATANATVLTTAIQASVVAQGIDAQQDAVLAGLKTAVKTASAAVDAANAAYQADKTAANLATLVKAQEALEKATADLAKGPSLTPGQKEALAAANARVAAAITARETACRIVAPTTTAAPTTTVAPPTTTTSAPTTVRVPSAINTGWAA